MRIDLDSFDSDSPQNVLVPAKALKELLCSTEDSVEGLNDTCGEIRASLDELKEIFKGELQSTSRELSEVKQQLAEVKEELGRNTRLGVEKADEVIAAIQELAAAIREGQ